MVSFRPPAFIKPWNSNRPVEEGTRISMDKGLWPKAQRFSKAYFSVISTYIVVRSVLFYFISCTMFLARELNNINIRTQAVSVQSLEPQLCTSSTHSSRYDKAQCRICHSVLTNPTRYDKADTALAPAAVQTESSEPMELA